MSKKQVWLVVIVVLLVVVATLVVNKSGRENDEVTVGAILPLTGDAGSYGVGLKRGMDLALDAINLNDGIKGRDLIIAYEDSQADPAKAVSAFNKLRSVDGVPMVLGAMFSAGTLAIAPIAERSKTVLLSPTASAVELTDAGDYIFRIYPSDTYDGIYLAKYARDKLKAKKIAIVFMQTASISAIVDVFRENFEAAGGQVVVAEAYNEGDVDFRSQLTKAKTLQPDVIFIPGYLKEMANLLRQAKELGVEGPFLSISTFFDPKLIELAGNAAEGVGFSAPAFDPESNLPVIKKFVEAFRSKYGQEPDILAAYGYDVVNIAAKALQLAEDDLPGSIKSALYSIQGFPGVTGETSFDENGDVKKQLRIMYVKDGQFKAVE